MNQLTDKRQALPKYTVLDFGAEGSRGYSYTITAESGRGASCIVYQGYYENSLGEKKTVYIKECYPFSLKMSRSASGELTCTDEAAFESHKKRFKDSFSLCNRIFETEGLTNTTSNYMDIHEKNGTLYTVITYRQGQELSLSDDRPLKETIRIIKSVAKAIRKIHDNGYLYLDTKPDNVFVLDEMNESIHLFDFDSMIPIDAQGDMRDYRLFYSKGFAPLEQRKGRLDLISRPTDVYGVGALLFYMVYGRIPEAPDCEPFATYNYDDARYEAWRYRDRLFSGMSEFFKKTLAVSTCDRYETMDPVVDQLALLEKDADLATMFIKDSYYPVRIGMVGRETESKQICDFIDSEEGCLFVIGMGGIGKSTLVRSCLDRKREDIDTVLYLYFHDSLIDTIADDKQLMVNTLERMSVETTEEYFDRKLQTIRRITEDQKVVLVIDNFEGELGEEFAAIREAFCQVIVISRTDPEVEDDPVLFVDAVEESERRALFERYLARPLEDTEKPEFDTLMDHIQGHTLATEVIAKQIKRSLLTLKQAVEITAKAGFSKISGDKVAFSRDGVHNHKAVVRILSDIFTADDLNEAERAILQSVSLFDQPGILKSTYTELSSIPDSTLIHDLSLSGWITEDGDVLSIHPVIREAIQRWGWHIFATDTVRYMMNGLIGGEKPLVMSMLKNVKPYDIPRQTREYYGLLCDWLSKAPRDEEEFLLSVKELIDEATEYSEPEKLMRGVDFLNYVLCEAREFDDASEVLAIMEEYVSGIGDPYLIGLFESTLSQFYDCVLNGAYAPDDEEAGRIFNAMIEAIDRSIDAMDEALSDAFGDVEKTVKANYELLRYELDYNVMFVRNYDSGEEGGPEDGQEDIREDGKELLNEIRSLKNAVDSFVIGSGSRLPEDKINELTAHMNLTWAWLHTMVTKDKDEVRKTVKEIWEAPSAWTNQLDEIDFKHIPCAEMLFRIGGKAESEEILFEAVAICDEYEGVIPYERKKEELLEHIEDVRTM